VAFSRDLVPPVVEQVPGFSARIGKFDRFAPLNRPKESKPANTSFRRVFPQEIDATEARPEHAFVTF
jgi:hypothetical protein